LTADEEQVLSLIDPAEVVSWTRELVRIPSVYRPQRGESEEKAARWVEARMEEMGLEVSWEEVEPGRPNVVGVWRGVEDGPTLMFEGHTDVVTAGDVSQWQHDPFGAEVEDGRIYGRGAADMKGGLVAALCAVKAIVESGVPLKGRILLAALADEEGLMKGVKHFVHQGWAEGVDAAIICEPQDNHLGIAQKGVMWVRITAQGRMAHGAMPFVGVNPIYPMGELLTTLRLLEAEEMGRAGHDLLGWASITPTIIAAPVEGDPQHNVMPARCTLTLDIRLVPGQSPEEIANSVQGLLERVRAGNEGVDFTLEVIESRPPTATPREEPIVRVMAQAYHDLTGQQPVYSGVPGSTDGTILHAWAGVPIVTCGPGGTYIPHCVDEYVEIEQLVEAARLYALTAMRFLGGV